jgi:hypothetical protein
MNIAYLNQIKHHRPGFSRPVIRPHDPCDRIMVEAFQVPTARAAFSAWEVRIFDPAGGFHHYFARKGMLHIQLWNRHFGISVLSPSAITNNRFEGYPIEDWKYSSLEYEKIERRFRRCFDVRLPDRNQFERICEKYVVRPSQEAKKFLPDSERTTFTSNS